VIDVGEQDAVDAVRGEPGIGLGTEDRNDVGDPLLGGVRLEQVSISGWMSTA
jgi:hypothetical protein